MEKIAMCIARFFALVALLGLASPLRAFGSGDPALILQHLFADQDCEAAPEFLGDWAGHGDVSGDWTIQGLKNQKYRLVEENRDSETGHRLGFDICVAHINGNLFFDATLRIMNADGQQPVLKDDETLFWVPLHLIGKLEINDSQIQFQLLDDSWLQDQFKSGRLQFPYSRNDDGEYILTASSKELKEFAAHFASVAEAFSCIEAFSRMPNGGAPANTDFSRDTILPGIQTERRAAIPEGRVVCGLKDLNGDTQQDSKAEISETRSPYCELSTV